MHLTHDERDLVLAALRADLDSTHWKRQRRDYLPWLMEQRLRRDEDQHDGDVRALLAWLARTKEVTA